MGIFDIFNKKIESTSFEDLKNILVLDDISKLEKAKSQGLDFTIKDSYTNGNILHHYINCFDGLNYSPDVLIKFFIDCGIDINQKENKRSEELSALHMACVRNNLTAIKILLLHKADIEIQDKNGNTVLWQVVMNYRGESLSKEIIQFLLNRGASLETKNYHDSSPEDVINTIGGGIDAGHNNPIWDLRDLLKS